MKNSPSIYIICIFYSKYEYESWNTSVGSEEFHALKCSQCSEALCVLYFASLAPIDTYAHKTHKIILRSYLPFQLLSSALILNSGQSLALQKIYIKHPPHSYSFCFRSLKRKETGALKHEFFIHFLEKNTYSFVLHR